MSVLSRRVAPALALLALAASALPGHAAGGFGSVAVSDVDVFVATVKIPGGLASVTVYVVDETGADLDAGSTPGAAPTADTYAFGCVRVERGKLKDFGCGEFAVSAATLSSDLSTGTLKFNVPSSQGKSRLAADLTLTATGPAETTPGHSAFHSVPDFVFVGASVSDGRPASVAGTVSSTRAGGGKVAATTWGELAREKWVDAYVVTY